jgi:hypothetical protein
LLLGKVWPIWVFFSSSKRVVGSIYRTALSDSSYYLILGI